MIAAAWKRFASGSKREARKARFARVVWRVGMEVVVEVRFLMKASLQPMARRRVAVVVLVPREERVLAGAKNSAKAVTMDE